MNVPLKDITNILHIMKKSLSQTPLIDHENLLETFGKSLPSTPKFVMEPVNYYSMAKKAEFCYKNLEMAEFYFRLAIKNNQRVDSAVKDLATVIHQRGNTEDACKLLEGFKSNYKGDMNKYENLLNNLKKQISPTGNVNLKKLIILSIPKEYNELMVLSFFKNPNRIVSVEFISNTALINDQLLLNQSQMNNINNSNLINYSLTGKIALLTFNSFSQAKKTLDSLQENNFIIFWVTSSNRIVAKANKNQMKIRNIRKNEAIWKEMLFFSLDNGEDDIYNEIKTLKNKKDIEGFGNEGKNIFSDYLRGYENMMKIKCELFSLEEICKGF